MPHACPNGYSVEFNPLMQHQMDVLYIIRMLFIYEVPEAITFSYIIFAIGSDGKVCIGNSLAWKMAPCQATEKGRINEPSNNHIAKVIIRSKLSHHF